MNLWLCYVCCMGMCVCVYVVCMFECMRCAMLPQTVTLRYVTRICVCCASIMHATSVPDQIICPILLPPSKIMLCACNTMPAMQPNK
ncbi:hypothetical protein K505DRAFT_33275 [Melanomma pulvis-pyrius CBS 109.77]|uniref:Uncharacterized protein n=1 Tax=Melanomma pulvis-pyrius CBS 109.77 TaxID=1314802 RepID=A0A6A6XBT8_9PLEO|nr:hypothetical protein K505DRAFT_33275 [Melanomma pulvis-pyrius CBS 109.77]